ncbi:hypothetical protein WR25_15680 isoform A [Diploscapter pachys]|uniref:Phosphatidylinositol transfer protein N-terminal domain-containing protein n=1 Tax=Diploscapter pachys TaxID=2018661 RepID=A0A2A2J3N7_9BILA|nr:hypothetical protein WR25_15680 isoform A [Diploscapter pachys]
MEYRIALPLELEEYNRGLLYGVAEASKNETGGGEGVELVEQYDFIDETLVPGKPPMSGTFTHKIYRIKSKCPWMIQKLLHEDAFEIHEESWNAYPYCKTICTNPKYMKDNFYLCIESIHLEDEGDMENPLNGPPKRDIVYLDICDDSLIHKNDYDKNTDPKLWHSEAANRGPLERDWTENRKTPLIYAYKMVSIKFKWKGLQKMIEKAVQKAYPRLFAKFNRECVCWIDQWHNMSMASILEFEQKLAKECKEQMKDNRKRGMTYHEHT